MLKKRVVAIVIVRDGIVVQSIGFKKYLPVGKPEIAVEFLCQWGIDEIILIDISATKRGIGPDIKMIDQVAKKCLVPLTVGGGITELSHVDQLIHGGADKVCLNHAVYENPSLVSEIAKIFGAQCVVFSLDAIKIDGNYQAYNYLGKCNYRYSAETYARLAVNWGAGEIFLNSIDRDGFGIGFDIPLVSEICNLVNIPVICAGGAGSPQHFVEVFISTEVNAAAAANFFHFSEHAVTIAKSVLLQRGIPIRHDTHVDYLSALFDQRGRQYKKPESYLESLMFELIKREVI